MNKTVPVILGGLILTGIAVAEQQAGYDKLDQNRDGVISQQEADAAPGLKDAWDRVDTNMDGLVDRSEFSAFETTETDNTQSGE